MSKKGEEKKELRGKPEGEGERGEAVDRKEGGV